MCGSGLGRGGSVEQLLTVVELGWWHTTGCSAEEPVQGPFLVSKNSSIALTRVVSTQMGLTAHYIPAIFCLSAKKQIFAFYFKAVHPACGASPDLAAGVGSNRGGTVAVVWGTAVGSHIVLGRQNSWLSAWSTGIFLFLGGCCGLQYFLAVFPRASASLGLG